MSTTTEFKVGDIIKIKEYSDMKNTYTRDEIGNIELGGIIFNDSMKKYCGKIGKIVKMTRGYYRIKFKGQKKTNTFCFCDEMLIGAKTGNRYKLKKLMKQTQKNNTFDEELL